jgi:O-antigen ligase
MIRARVRAPIGGIVVRVVVRLLLACVVAMAFVAADAAETFGLGTLRVVAGACLVGLLAGLPLLADRRLEVGHLALPLLLLLLLAGIAVADVPSGIDPIEYKILLLLPPMLAAPQLARRIPAVEVVALLHALLALYVVVTALLVATGDSSLLYKGGEAAPRLDASGSVVTHASMCLVYLLCAAASFAGAAPLGRAVRLGVGVLALAMLLATATRTPYLALLIFVAARLLAGDGRQAVLRAALAGGIGLVLVLVVWTALVSDAAWLRLAGASQADYSTGRLVSIRYWLRAAADGPLGLGAVRATLAGGRPALATDADLEWPHNELVRLWVEAGPLGLAFALLLLGAAWRRGLRAARSVADPAVRVVILALLADLSAQMLFQNFLNSIYHATAWVTLLWMLTARTTSRPAERAPAWPDRRLRPAT